MVPTEAVGSGIIKVEWWKSRLPDLEVVEDLRSIPPNARRSAWAFIGYTCYWHHEETPTPHPAARDIEGSPPIHPACAAALSGATWSAVATREIPWHAGEGNVRSFSPRNESVTIGLYRAVSVMDPATP